MASTCRSTGRRPIRSPPGFEMMTRPKRDSMGPSRMKLERIFMAASSGTNGQSASWAVMASVSGSGHATSKPMSLMASRMICTSLMFGTLRSTTGSSVRAAAAISLRTAFLAPAMRTSPCSGLPPVTMNFCIGAESTGPQAGQASFHSCAPVWWPSHRPTRPPMCRLGR